MGELLAWVVIVGLPVAGLAPAMALRRRRRRRWTAALLWTAGGLALVYEGGLLYGAASGNVCLGDCYAAPTEERVAGQIVFTAAFLLVLIGVVALVAFLLTFAGRRRH
jgi:hypothetical protein